MKKENSDQSLVLQTHFRKATVTLKKEKKQELMRGLPDEFVDKDFA